MKRIVQIAAVGGMLLAAPMMAQEYGNSLAAMLSGYSPVSKDRIDTAAGAGLRLGLAEGDTHAVELEYDHLFESDLKKVDGHTHGNVFMTNYLYHFADRSESLRPYLIAGAGYETWSTDKIKSGGIAAVGAGIKYAMSENVQLRAEVRDLFQVRNWGQNIVYSVGLAIPFGKTAQPQAPIKVEAQTTREETAAPLGSLDSDGDGVLDTRDKCPDTPSGTIVDENGCPAGFDGDGDGVPDSIDRCPHTPKGFKVDKTGCAVGVTLYLHFAFDSAEISPKGMMTVKEVAEFMKKHPEVTADLEGHTDSIGTQAYNLKLSFRRAEAVKKALVAMGIDPSRLSVHGYGESRPIASNDTPEGRAKNRRVEVILKPGKDQ